MMPPATGMPLSDHHDASGSLGRSLPVSLPMARGPDSEQGPQPPGPEQTESREPELASGFHNRPGAPPAGRESGHRRRGTRTRSPLEITDSRQSPANRESGAWSKLGGLEAQQARRRRRGEPRAEHHEGSGGRPPAGRQSGACHAGASGTVTGATDSEHPDQPARNSLRGPGPGERDSKQLQLKHHHDSWVVYRCLSRDPHHDGGTCE